MLSASILAQRQAIFHSTLFPLISQSLKMAFHICENLDSGYFCESSFLTLAQSKLAMLSLSINIYMNSSSPFPSLSLLLPLSSPTDTVCVSLNTFKHQWRALNDHYPWRISLCNYYLFSPLPWFIFFQYGFISSLNIALPSEFTRWTD